MRKKLLLAHVVWLVFLAGSALAYTIVLKDGSKITAREEYRVEGDRAIIILTSGTETSLPLADIDVARTQEANKTDVGTAVLMEDATQIPVQQGAPESRQTLTDLLASREGARELDISRRESAARTTTVRKTDAGFNDLSTMVRNPFASPQISGDIQTLLRAEKAEGVQVHQGTESARPFLEFTTNSEGAVFQALEVSARVLLAIRERHPGRVEAFEVLMTTNNRTRAGQFLITPEAASELASKRIDTASFFLNYVEF